MVTGSRRGENVPTGLELARRRFSERARNQKSLPRRGRKPEGREEAPQRLHLTQWLLRSSPVGKMEKPQNFVLRLSALLPVWNQPDGTRRERPSTCVGWSGYWFESEEQIKQEPPRQSLEGSCFMRSPDWTRTSNPSINSRMLCQLSYGGLFCSRCWFPLQRVITIPVLCCIMQLRTLRWSSQKSAQKLYPASRTSECTPFG